MCAEQGWNESIGCLLGSEILYSCGHMDNHQQMGKLTASTGRKAAASKVLSEVLAEHSTDSWEDIFLADKVGNDYLKDPL